MIDEPGRRGVAAGRTPGSGADLVARLREGMADRVPPALRKAPAEDVRDGADPVEAYADEAGPGPDDGRPGPRGGRRVPRAAAVAALAVAAVVSAVLVARALASTGTVTTLPPRGSVAAQGAGRSPSTAPGEALPGEGTGGTFAAGAGGAGSPSGAGPSATAAALVLDVTGRVRRPGLVRLAPGSRVWDAVVAAGGPATGARLDRINLARRPADGEQIVVPGPGDPVPPAPASPGAAAGAAGLPGGQDGTAVVVDLNTASTEQLDGLPGVGPVLASRILAWRTQHGRFSRIEELREVTGIGEKLFAQLRTRVRV